MAKKRAVFLSDNVYKLDSVYSSEIRRKLAAHVDLYDVVIGSDQLNDHEAVLHDASYVFSTWGIPQLTNEDIAKYLPNLEVVFYAAGISHHFAKPYLRRGVKVTNAEAANGIPVSQYTLAQILLANKGFYQSAALTRDDRQKAKHLNSLYPGNYEAKIGLIGMGVIASKVAELLKPFDLEVLAYDPYLTPERAEQLNVRKVELSELFATCQTISNHLPNKESLVGLLDKSYFELMGDYATFLNTGRGAQVVEEDLAEALRHVPTRTAILDVTIKEPLEQGNPLLALDNVFLTPHIAGSTGQEQWRLAEYMLNELILYEQEQKLNYSITLDMLS